MRDRYASLREGLVGAWIPSVSGSGLLLPDLSGQGNNGTLTNMDASDWVSSQYGRALDFDGVDDYVDLDNSKEYVATTSPFTFTCWAYLRSYTMLFPTIATLKSNSVTPFVIHFSQSINYDGILFGSRLNWGRFRTGNGSSLPGSWVSVSIVYDGINSGQSSSFKIYKNGEQQPIITAGQFASVININRIGLPSGGISNVFNGQLDDIRIYNRALSESEIKLLASRPGIGLRPQRRTMYYAPPTGARRRRILTSMP